MNVDQLHPDIICITETWLHAGLPDQLYSIKGFTLFRCDSSLNVGYNGVCVYVSDKITESYGVRVLSSSIPRIDNLFISLSSTAFSILIGCVYRPHPSPSDELLLDHIRFLSETGDFNFREIGWPITSSPPPNTIADSFMAKTHQS